MWEPKKIRMQVLVSKQRACARVKSCAAERQVFLHWLCIVTLYSSSQLYKLLFVVAVRATQDNRTASFPGWTNHGISL